MDIDGMRVEGWVTKTITETHEEILYGIFEDKQSADDWAKNLLPSTIVLPIFTPQFNRG